MRRIAEAVEGCAAEGGGCVLAALDGRAGAGKSTLAALLAEHLGGTDRATVVHGDDFLRPMPDDRRFSLDTVEGYHGYFDWPRLRDQVLAPLTRGRPARGTVIVEGVLTARPELAGFYDLTVFVDTPSEVCLQRLYARGRTPRREAWIARWRAVEEYYLTSTGLRERAHLTVHGQ
ncbi:uridine kinase [Streptomyces abikoensis]|uniref:Uridine kinase n=1 Tax=Streptomyces abikoensis TaxID=97398 RepID=A0ABW7TEW8_9ACTN